MNDEINKVCRRKILLATVGGLGAILGGLIGLGCAFHGGHAANGYLFGFLTMGSMWLFHWALE